MVEFILFKQKEFVVSKIILLKNMFQEITRHRIRIRYT